MSCFCDRSMQQLRLALPALNVSLRLPPLPGAHVTLALSDWLGARALPALPWAPDPAWLSLLLPQLRLNASAMATISALAQLRAQLLATIGIDLLIPGQATALARLVATLNVRLSAIGPVLIDPLAWLNLASLNGAIVQIQLALDGGLLPPSASLNLAMTMPGGLPMASWRAFLAALAALAPLLAVAAQLGINLSENFTAQLAAVLRLLRGIVLPALPHLALMASLTAGLSAVARLQASLGINPLQLGFPAVHALVSARLSALLPALCASLRLSLHSPNLLAELLALLPPLPYCPTTLATQAVVHAAMSIHAQALASLTWQVPDASSLLAVRIGLPVVSFTAQLNAALGISATLPAPCASMCDAAAIMRAVSLAA